VVSDPLRLEVMMLASSADLNEVLNFYRACFPPRNMGIAISKTVLLKLPTWRNNEISQY
jgi:hypothetical protein